VKRCASALLSVLLSGCYFYQLGAGQLRLVNEQRPLADALRDEQDPERRRMLAMVPAVLSFAECALQLAPGYAYRGYFATEETGITHVVLASEKTSLTPYTWWFPVVGEVPYKSHFDEADALSEEHELAVAGYDTWVGRATAYSTLGFFRDPVTTVMMQQGPVAFVEVLIHELTHQRFYVPGQTDFNEQLASFVAHRGTEQFFVSRLGDDAEVRATLDAYFARQARVEAMMVEAFGELETLYAAGLPEARVLRDRQRVFDRLEGELTALFPEQPPERLRVNNARLLQYRRYLDSTDDLERIWRDGRGWAGFWRGVEVYADEAF